MTIRERVDHPECDGTDAAHPAYWRGHDHAVATICLKITEILDGKDDGKGIASEPWEPVRRRLLAMNSAGGQMTALERAEAIAGWVYDRKREPVVFAELAEKIHRACIDHSNAELERRRAVTSKLLRAINTLRQILVALRKAGMKHTALIVEETLKALEGGDGM